MLLLLLLLESAADGAVAVVPGHGSVGGAGQLRARIKQDRAYVEALRDGAVSDDPRLGPSAPLDWLPGVHQWQAEQIAQRNEEPQQRPALN